MKSYSGRWWHLSAAGNSLEFVASQIRNPYTSADNASLTVFSFRASAIYIRPFMPIPVSLSSQSHPSGVKELISICIWVGRRLDTSCPNIHVYTETLSRWHGRKCHILLAWPGSKIRNTFLIWVLGQGSKPRSSLTAYQNSSRHSCLDNCHPLTFSSIAENCDSNADGHCGFSQTTWSKTQAKIEQHSSVLEPQPI